MSDHDALCRNRWTTKTEVGSCQCALIARVVDRERERQESIADARVAPWLVGAANAEAVAARLVEVIVQMQADIDHARAVADGEARR